MSTGKICCKTECSEKSPAPTAFGYFYKRSAQEVEDRQPILFTDFVGKSLKIDGVIPFSGFYNIKYKVIILSQSQFFVGLYKNGQLISGTKYGTLSGTELVADVIVDLSAGDVITLQNLSNSTISLPELIAPYPPNGINADLTITLISAK